MDAPTRIRTLAADKLDFAPGILKLQEAPPSPLPRVVLWVLLALVAAAFVWAAIGRLDIIAVAQGQDRAAELPADRAAGGVGDRQGTPRAARATW